MEEKEYKDPITIAEETDVEFEEESAEIQEDTLPFEPEKISIEQKTLSLDAILRRIKQETIVLTPAFQRNEVWDDTKKSQLIESLLMKIPIPMFYLSSDDMGILSVVDGLQRMSTIRDFVLGQDYLDSADGKGNFDESKRGKGLKLKHLEFCTDLEGKQFCDLSPLHQNRIFESNLLFTIINPGTPEEVQRNIFKRINTGGVRLTDQEMRNAMYIGQATNLLLRLVDSDEFQAATGYSLRNAKRAEDMEVALRLVAFIVRDFTGYSRTVSTDQWLSDTMIILNSLPSLTCKEYQKFCSSKRASDPKIVNKMTIEEIEDFFSTAMIRSREMFGNHAFRKSWGEMMRKPINRCLFEMWGYILGHLTDAQYCHLMSNRTQFLHKYYQLLEDVDFLRSITTDSMKHIALKYRFNTLIDLINPYITC